MTGPVGLGIVTVTRHARRFVDNRFARATRRLNSVDLPTLGRPTIATIGRLARLRRQIALSAGAGSIIYKPISANYWDFASSPDRRGQTVREKSGNRAALPALRGLFADLFEHAPRLPIKIPLCESRSVWIVAAITIRFFSSFSVNSSMVTATP